VKIVWLTKLTDKSQGVSQAEIDSAIHPDSETLAKDASAGEKPKHKGRHFMAAIKSATKGGVESLLGADRLKAAAGREHAQNRLGVLKKGSDEEAGPIDFPCRYRGKRGRAYITTSATSPAVSWTSSKEKEDAVWSVAIADIQVCFFVFLCNTLPPLVFLIVLSVAQRC